MQKLRNLPFFSSKITKGIILFLFPFFICFTTEFGHLQNLNEFLSFATEKSGIIIFDAIFINAIFWVLSFIIGRTWISGLITSLLFYICTCVEYYKYYISGAHFLFSDLAMTKNVADMAQFTRIHFNFILLLDFFLVAFYVILLYICDIKINKKIVLRSSASIFITALTVLFICVPALFTGVCTALKVDNSYSFNAFSDDTRFDNNKFIGNFAVSLNQQITNKVKEPENYSEELVNSMLEENDTPVSGEVTKPNIIFIMSESFGDFRNLNGMEVPEDIYKNFDKAKEISFYGNTIVPTFGGNTVRTEFELMFGLPVKSLRDATIPHALIPDDIELDTFAQMYKKHGYHTTYLHPFSSSFYNREDAYSEYGFDRLIFIDDLTVPVNYFRDYVDDETLYRQAEKVMSETDGPDYIHITTMQNHQPYGEDGTNEVNIYLEGIKLSCDELLNFFDKLKSFKEPTIVFFVGDHLPFFSPGNDLYQNLGIDAQNCQVLYDETYLIWNNYNLSYDSVPEFTVSAFYLPHIIYNLSGLTPNEFNNTILSAMEQEPVYSTPYSDENFELLDILTYDRTIGMGYSDEEIVSPFIKTKTRRDFSLAVFYFFQKYHTIR